MPCSRRQARDRGFGPGAPAAGAGTDLRCTPSPRCFPEHSRQIQMP